MVFSATTTRESEGQLHPATANGRMEWARMEGAAARVLRQLPFYCVSAKLQNAIPGTAGPSTLPSLLLSSLLSY